MDRFLTFPDRRYVTESAPLNPTQPSNVRVKYANVLRDSPPEETIVIEYDCVSIDPPDSFTANLIDLYPDLAMDRIRRRSKSERRNLCVAESNSTPGTIKIITTLGRQFIIAFTTFSFEFNNLPPHQFVKRELRKLWFKQSMLQIASKRNIKKLAFSAHHHAHIYPDWQSRACAIEKLFSHHMPNAEVYLYC